MTEFLDSVDAATLLTGVMAGSALTLGIETLGEFMRRIRSRAAGPSPKAQLHLFDADGDHFLSAKLTTRAAQTLLEDLHAGRLPRPLPTPIPHETPCD